MNWSGVYGFCTSQNSVERTKYPTPTLRLNVEGGSALYCISLNVLELVCFHLTKLF